MKNQFSIKLLTTCILLAAGNTNAASVILPEEETVLTFDEAPKSQLNQPPKSSSVNVVRRTVESPLQISATPVKPVVNRDFQTEYQEKIKQANELAKAAKEQVVLAERLKQEAEAQAKLKAAEDRKAKLEAERMARIKAEDERKAKEEAKRQAKAQAKAQAESERQARLQAERQAKAQVDAERAAKLEAERQAKAQADAERAAKLEAARKAKAQAESEYAAKLEAERKAKVQADAEQAAKLEGERKAKAQADAVEAAKVEAERKAKAQADAVQAAKVEAERKARLAAEQQAKLQADKERKAQIEAERAASVAQIKTHKPSMAAPKQSLSQQAVQLQPPPTSYNVDAEEIARKSVAEKLSKQAAQHNMFDSSISLPSTQQYNKGTTALQRATSSIVTGYAVPQNSPKVQALGFRASDSQVKAFDEKYQYNLSQLTPIPPEIGDIRLVPIAKLNGDSLSLFLTPQDRQRVEEYLMYHPHYAKVFSNFVKRAMTLNNGHTGSLSVKDAVINELSFKISGISVPSVMNINSATDSYLYITSRLNEADQVKFWNWVNVVRTGSVVDVPSWVRLVDVMYSSN